MLGLSAVAIDTLIGRSGAALAESDGSGPPDDALEFIERYQLPTDSESAGPAARSVPGFYYRSLAQHTALGIQWGYPFDHRGYTTALVDGYNTPTYGGHKGVDYFSSPQIGSTIYAVADGVVTTAQQADVSDLGAHVVMSLSSGGLYAQYGHMTPGTLMVSNGQRVTRGTPLGKTGWSGRVEPKAPSAAHLHLAIRSEPNVLWNPLWLVHDAPLPRNTPLPPPVKQENTMANPIINVIKKYGDSDASGTIYIGRDNGTFEALRPPYANNIRGILGVVFLGSGDGGKDVIPTISEGDFAAVKPIWAQMRTR